MVKINARRIKNLLFFSILYGLLKVSSFSGPLLFANFTTKLDYGVFEYSFAVGTILALTMDMGLSPSYPLYVLEKKDLNTGYFLSLYFVVSLFLFYTITSLLYFYSIIISATYLSVLIALIWQGQLFISSVFKTDGKAFLSILVDSLFFLLINLFLFTLFFFKIQYDIFKLLALLNFYVVVMLVASVVDILKNATLTNLSFVNLKLIRIISINKDFILNGFAMILIVNLAKIAIEYYFGLSEVADYSATFRVSFIVLGIYQVFNIYFFGKIYTLSKDEIDYWFLAIGVLVTFVAVTLFHFFPLLATLISILSNLDKTVFASICTFAIFWIASALNEGVLGREGLLPSSNMTSFAIVIVFLASVYIMHLTNTLSPSRIVYLHVSAMFLLIQSQYFWLSRSDIILIKTQIYHSFIFLLTLIYLFVIQQGPVL